MNWAQFKDLVSHMCFAGALVSCTRGGLVAGWNPFYCNNKYFCH